MKRTLATLLVLASAGSLAQQGGPLSTLKFDPAMPRAGQEVKITVGTDGEPPALCGLVVHFDDGTESRQFKINGSDNRLPLTFGKVFAKPGSYSIKAEGRKITSHFPCVGVAQQTLTVEAVPAAAAPAPAAAAATAAKPAGPACPEGYALKGKAGKAGDFTCSAGKGAKKPEKVMDCGDRLEYFQTKAALGCRKPK